MTKPIFKNIDTNAEYSDAEINTYISNYINIKLGGYANQCSYLLKNTFKENDNDYFVLVTPAVDTKEKSKNITSFLDKTSDNIQPSITDVFDEISTILKNEKDHKKALYIKILFPFNLTDSHWLTAEIKLHKNNNDYDIELIAHDPFGKSDFLNEEIEKFNKIIDAKIKALNSGANITFKTSKSPYPPRQNSSDSKSCGAITAEELIMRIKGKSLALKNNATYPQGAKELRKKHLRFLDKNIEEADASFKNFIKHTALKSGKTPINNVDAKSLTVYEQLDAIATNLKIELKKINEYINSEVALSNDKFVTKLKALSQTGVEYGIKVAELSDQHNTEINNLYNMRDKKIEELKKSANEKAQKEIDGLVNAAVTNKINRDDIRAKRIKAYISYTTSLLLALTTVAKTVTSQITSDATLNIVMDGLVTIIGALSAAAIGYVGVGMQQDANKQENIQKQEVAKTQSDTNSNAALVSKFSSVLSTAIPKGTTVNTDLGAALESGLKDIETTMNKKPVLNFF